MKLLLQHLKDGGLKAEMLKGASGSAGLQVANLILSLVSGILLARTLGPESYGIYTFVLSVITLLILPTKAGLPALLVRETAKYHLSKEWGLMRGLLTFSNRFVLSYSLIVVGMAAAWILLRLGNDPGIQAETFLWGLFLLPLISLGAVRAGTLRGLRMVLSAQLPEHVVQPLVLIILVVLALLLGVELTPVASIQINVAGAFIAFVLGSWLLIRSFPYDAVRTKSEYAIRPWAASLLPLSVFSGLQLLNPQISILLLGVFSTNEEVGLFRVAATGSAVSALGLQAINVPLAPQVARLYNASKIKKLQKLITISTRAAVTISIPIALVLIVWGDLLIDVIFGEKYLPAASALAILCLGQIVNTAAGSVALILNMTGNDKSTVLGAAIALVVNLSISVILIPLFGLVGAAIGSAIAMIVWNIVLMVMVNKKVGINTSLFAK